MIFIEALGLIFFFLTDLFSLFFIPPSLTLLKISHIRTPENR